MKYENLKFKIYGMSCSNCKRTVENVVSGLDNIENVTVNLLLNEMTVSGDFAIDDIINQIKNAGYDAKLYDGNDNDATLDPYKAEMSAIFKRLILSASILILLIIIKHLSIYNCYFDLIAAILVLLINRKILVNGFKCLLYKNANMDTLVSLGALSAFIYSILYINSDTGLYFDSTIMILTLINVGKLLESKAKVKTTDALKDLISLKASFARVLLPDETEIKKNVEELKINDLIIIKAGNIVPIDCKIVKGFATINESMLTGESIPRDKTIGDICFEGTIINNGVINAIVIHNNFDSTLSKIIESVKNICANKAPIERIADIASKYFVLVVSIIAIITFIVWVFVSKDISFSIGRAISVLVISCPCALGLATPTAIMVGSGLAAKHGILFKNAESLEQLGKVDIIALDKTGTLTKGELKIDNIEFEDASYLSYLYTIESLSNHPISKAVLSYCKDKECDKLDYSDFKVIPGEGIQCIISDKLVKCIKDKNNSNILSVDGKVEVRFSVVDDIRSDSKELISRLKSLNIKPVIISGDNEIITSNIAGMLGVTEYYASVFPDDKAKIIDKLKKDGNVLMVGDGINDALALSTATLSMSLNGASDIAMDSSNIILMNNKIGDIYNSIIISKSTIKTIKQNLFFAFMYNSLCIPIAAGVLILPIGLMLTPEICSICMALSSIFVVTNALRLRFINLYGENIMKMEVKIKGMMCEHCEKHVKDALLKIDGVISVTCSHKNNNAIIESVKDIDINIIRKAVTDAGYECLS